MTIATKDTIVITPDGEGGTDQHLIPSLSIANLLQQRDRVIELLESALTQIRQAYDIAQAARLGFPDISVSRDWGGHGRPITGDSANFTERRELCQTCIDAEGWETLLNDSGLRSVMSAAKRQDVDESIRNHKVLALTRETIVATFRTFHESRLEMFEQGVIDCFRKLSWDYKTNLLQKFGKRIIVTYLTSYSTGNFPTCDQLDDLLRVFHVCDGKPEADHRRSTYHLVSQVMRERQQWPTTCANEYFSIRLFRNGNGHVTFTRSDLVQRLNAILAKHFPDALPALK